MRRTKFISAIVLALALSVTAPSFAVPGVEIPVESTFSADPSAVGTSFIYDFDSGVVKKINEATNTVVQVASGWPALPNGYIRNQQIRIRKTSTGNLFAGAILELDSGDKFLWVSVLGPTGWSSWVQMDQAAGHVNYINISNVAQSGSTFAFNYGLYYDSSFKNYVGTNYGGTWHSMLISDSSVAGTDLLYPNNQLTVSGQSQIQPVDYWYDVPTMNSWLPVPLNGSKFALVARANFATEPFVLQGNTFTSKGLVFTQIIDLATMTPTHRTLIGDAYPQSNGGYADSEGAHEIWWSNVWWNKAKNDLIVLATDYEVTDCPAAPEGVDSWNFVQGSCYQRSTLFQYDQSDVVQLAQISGLIGERTSLGISTLQTDDGIVGLFSTYRREISVAGDGTRTGWANNKSFTSTKWLKANSNLKFSAFSYTPVESAATSTGNNHWLFLYKGIAVDSNDRCADDGTQVVITCTLHLTFFGEGKSKTFNTGYVEVSNDTVDGALQAFSTGKYLALYKAEGTYNPDYVNTSTVRPNFYTPSVTKLTATLATVTSTLKVKKSVNLPVVSKQNHPVTWTLAAASKKFCTLTVTKVNGITTKAVVKGVKAGSCTLTAKTTNGFFYKTLNKTVKISIKK